MELNDWAREKKNIWTAFQAFQTYHAKIPFPLHAQLSARHLRWHCGAVGAFGAGRDGFEPRRTIGGDTFAGETMSRFAVLIEGAFERRRFLNLPRDFSPSSRKTTADSLREWRAVISFTPHRLRWRRDCALRS